MSTWLMKTEGDPLAAIRHFLAELWPRASLEGMLVPISQTGDRIIRNTLVHDPARLPEANPFVPVMRSNAGRLVAELARERPGARISAVLRACEVRALVDLVERDALTLDNWLIIGVDCLGCFPAQDFEWRVEKAGGVEQLTHEVLRNARQGGIAIDRFRSACQACARPEPAHVDLCIDLLGLPVQEAILVSARDDALASELGLDQITAGPAPAELVAEHETVLQKIEDRRLHVRERQLSQPVADLPATLDELVDFLMACQPCTSCLEACPVVAEEVLTSRESGTMSRALVRRWLLSCAECGMCEQACPRGIPLAAVMNRISRELKSEPLAI